MSTDMLEHLIGVQYMAIRIGKNANVTGTLYRVFCPVQGLKCYFM